MRKQGSRSHRRPSWDHSLSTWWSSAWVENVSFERVYLFQTCGSSRCHIPSHRYRLQHPNCFLKSSWKVENIYLMVLDFKISHLLGKRLGSIQDQVPVNNILPALLKSPCFRSVDWEWWYFVLCKVSNLGIGVRDTQQWLLSRVGVMIGLPTHNMTCWG